MSDLTPAPDVPVALLDPPAHLDAPEATSPPTPSAPAWPPGPRRGRFARFLRGKESDAPWVRPALLTLLVATAVLYLWDLGASGWANSFYSAAVQAGSKSWKAFFFGSSDSSNFITVDKPPAFLWPMEISARIFGVNSWSILVPQALEGVATVGLVYLSVRRWFSAQAALLAGAVVALTPVAALMFRYNNPDAMLALLLTAATYATMRGLERAQTKWLVLAGALVGFGFITKMMQAFLILPVLAVVYLLAAPTGWWRRLWQVVLMGVSVVVAAGWWVAAVALTPAADRPYIGGSQDNSILNLIFGYNGFGRLSGNEAGSVGGRGLAGSMWGPTGFTRLFNSTFGNMMSWLLPGALVMGAVLLLLTLRARRTDRERAGLLLWGGSLVSAGLVISLAQGIIHPYYAVALAPPLGALVGISTMALWERRASWAGRIGLAAGLAATVAWTYVLLGRTSDWFPALRPFVAVVGALGVVAILGAAPVAFDAEASRRAGRDAGTRRRTRRAAVLDRGHRGHPAWGCDPVGDPDPSRWPRRPRGHLPRRWLPWGLPPGLRRYLPRPRRRWWRLPGRHLPRGWLPGRWVPRRRRPWRVGHRAHDVPRLCRHGSRFRRRALRRRLWRRPGRWRRVPERESVQCGAHQAPAGRGRPLHLGGRHGQLEQRRRLPVGQR